MRAAGGPPASPGLSAVVRSSALSLVPRSLASPSLSFLVSSPFSLVLFSLLFLVVWMDVSHGIKEKNK